MIAKNRFRISITSVCNMKCEYCHNEGNSKINMILIDDFVKILTLAKSLNLREIRLTGGEPLIHPHIFEMCKIAKNVFNFKVSINTNLVNFQVLENLLDHSLVDEIVVGIDYFDSEISKQSSIGIPSLDVLKRILVIKESYHVGLSLAIVYNYNDSDIKSFVDFGIKNRIRIKIIEQQSKRENKEHSSAYISMQYSIMQNYDIDYKIDEYQEINGFVDGVKVISFFPSLCRLKRCDLCKKLQFRISADLRIKRCIFDNSMDVSIFSQEAQKLF